MCFICIVYIYFYSFVCVFVLLLFCFDAVEVRGLDPVLAAARHKVVGGVALHTDKADVGTGRWQMA